MRKESGLRNKIAASGFDLVSLAMHNLLCFPYLYDRKHILFYTMLAMSEKLYTRIIWLLGFIYA